ncbi:hypothetical protein CDEST_05734 [Colletotrichum destructivum]|uniref:Uncharacterized protein n=1 Tax=Colletotrichum destructivum TaxID=34406 RepID=A0AAX4IBQ7_9PEZI|nr:hypothetical protein CDEST_05734 [Colletotrichum destructivum]
MYAPAPSSTGRMRQRSRPEGKSSLIDQNFGASPERDGAERPRDCRSTLRTGQGGGEKGVPRSNDGTKSMAGRGEAAPSCRV